MNRATDPTKAERLKEAVMAALQAAGGRMFMVNLQKTLFYADLLALREYGKTITGQEYLAFPRGPCIANYDRKIVKALESAGLARQENAESGYGKPVVVSSPMASFPHISPPMLEILQAIAKEASKLGAGSISNFSHDNPGWLLARKKSEAANGQAQPINMRFALQQLDNDAADAAWMSAKTLTPDELSAVDASEGEQGEDWGS